MSFFYFLFCFSNFVVLFVFIHLSVCFIFLYFLFHIITMMHAQKSWKYYDMLKK